LGQQADLLQIVGSDAQSNRVSDGFVESRVGSSSKDLSQRTILNVIIDVSCIAIKKYAKNKIK
jgi:hypothetical protein